MFNLGITMLWKKSNRSKFIRLHLEYLPTPMNPMPCHLVQSLVEEQPLHVARQNQVHPRGEVKDFRWPIDRLMASRQVENVNRMQMNHDTVKKKTWTPINWNLFLTNLFLYAEFMLCFLQVQHCHANMFHTLTLQLSGKITRMPPEFSSPRLQIPVAAAPRGRSSAASLGAEWWDSDATWCCHVARFT